MSDAPLSPSAPLIGIRQWRIEPTDDGVRLCGISASTIWRPGDDEAHQITDSMHDGFHAYTPRHSGQVGSWAAKNYSDETDIYGYVMGVIIGWGVVYVHTTGFRSQFARAVAVASWDEHVSRWESAYGVKDNKHYAGPEMIFPGGREAFNEMCRHYGVQTSDSVQECANYAEREGLGMVLDPKAHLAAEHKHALLEVQKKMDEAADLQRKADDIKRKLMDDDESASLIRQLKGVTA